MKLLLPAIFIFQLLACNSEPKNCSKLDKKLRENIQDSPNESLSYCQLNDTIGGCFQGTDMVASLTTDATCLEACEDTDASCLTFAELTEAAGLNPHAKHPVELAFAFKQIKLKMPEMAKETLEPFLHPDNEPEVYTYLVACLQLASQQFYELTHPIIIEDPF